ncbi:hypothetical protein [Sinorhizobium meliloti]|uniref:hypothetical protein n=1 Tax=Rhizobium meliloti TaxID=382 RepID=UPI003D65C2E2
MDIEIRNFTPLSGDSVKSDVRRLARANIYFSELETTLHGVTLTWHRHKGLGVMPPNARAIDGKPGVRWKVDGVFQKSLAGQMIGMLEEETGRPFDPLMTH